MNKTILAVAAVAAIYTLSISAAEKATEDSSKTEEVKSVAWYVANIKEARAKNQECYGNQNTIDKQVTPNCANSLQALKISFSGAN